MKTFTGFLLGGQKVCNGRVDEVFSLMFLCVVILSLFVAGVCASTVHRVSVTTWYALHYVSADPNQVPICVFWHQRAFLDCPARVLKLRDEATARKQNNVIRGSYSGLS